MLHKYMLYRETIFQLGLHAGWVWPSQATPQLLLGGMETGFIMFFKAEWVIGSLGAQTYFRITVNNIKNSKINWPSDKYFR